MIRIHRRRPLVRVGERLVSLTWVEHELIVTLGMMDNRLAPYQLLLDVVCESQGQTQSDQTVLWQKMARLKKKIGRNHLRCQKNFGYMLVGDVHFFG